MDVVTIAATIGLAITLGLLSIWDIRTRRLPDWLTLPLALAGLMLAGSAGMSTLMLHLLAALAGYLAFWAIAGGYRFARGTAGLGLGDAKLLAAAGAWLGPALLAPMVFAAAALGLLWVGGMAVAGAVVSGKTAIPFGPFLSASFLVCWLARISGLLA